MMIQALLLPIVIECYQKPQQLQWRTSGMALPDAFELLLQLCKSIALTSPSLLIVQIRRNIITTQNPYEAIK